MMLFDQVLAAIKDRQSFTLYPYYIGAFKPEGIPVHQFKELEIGKLGYLLQWWAQHALYKPKTISFQWVGENLQIIYDANTTAKNNNDDVSDSFGTDLESEATTD
jgi:hypothetical protein